ncbi:MAG: hypothetical protein ACLFV8_03270, partial [Alphaproteobacteria bacterium]
MARAGALPEDEEEVEGEEAEEEADVGASLPPRSGGGEAGPPELEPEPRTDVRGVSEAIAARAASSRSGSLSDGTTRSSFVSSSSSGPEETVETVPPDATGRVRMRRSWEDPDAPPDVSPLGCRTGVADSGFA